MKKRDVYDQVPDYWKTTDLENLFDINQNNKGYNIFNLNENIYLDIPEHLISIYTCQYNEMHWPLISYVIYGTTRLAWLLMKINNVKIEEMFLPKRSSENIKYIDKDFIPEIIKVINGYE